MKTISRHPRFRWTALFVMAAALLYGCKDFLENAAEPQGTLNERTLMNAQGVEGSLIAAYRALDWNNGVGGNWGSAVSNWVWGSVPSDDAYKGSEASDQPHINDIEGYHWSTGLAEIYLNEKWRAAYEGVVRSNATLRLLKAVLQGTPSPFTTDDAHGIAGEAFFLRAHFHFEAWRIWGNIPYYKEDDTDFREANATSAEVVTNILADLDSAIANLPTSPRKGQIGRATQWAAKAYKGRVLIYDGKFAEALTILREVRTSGPYALETSYDKVWTGFQNFANGKETVFAYQAAANNGEPNGNDSNYGERLNFPHSGSPFGCCGFHQPSQNLVNFYRVDGGTGLPLSLTDANWNSSSANFTGANNTTPVDPRLDWTVGRDGVPFKDWGEHKADWIRAPSYGGFYSAKKNVHEKASNAESTVGWVPTQLNSVNIHILRYADVLLLLAEAEVEAGAIDNARTIVNEIRTRAGALAQGPGTTATNLAVPINDPSITWATYRVGTYPSFPDQTFARNAVRNERRLEMAMEGQRFFDLRRWGVAEQVLNAYLTVEKTRRLYLAAAEAYTVRHRLYPIPAIQIELSRVSGENRLTQNPGW